MYGGLGLQDNELPPSDLLEVAKWESNASSLLDALASQLLTPRGTLIIDGWDLSDWMTAQMLFAMSQKVEPDQVHLFSATEELQQNAYIQAALKSGHLSIYDEHFGHFASASAQEGYLNLDTSSSKSIKKLIPVGREFAHLDISTWNRVTSSVRPIDVTLLEPFTRSSPEITYQRFRNFMGAAEGSPPWKAVTSGYHFERHFHRKLREAVVQAIDNNDKNNVIILAGQTATGKSIACTALAIDIARSGLAPVLYQSKRGDRPQLDDIEAFIEWAEASNAPPTLLIWDGMTNPDEYYSLGRQLRSRGRRAVVVGTTYANEDSSSSVLAPAAIGTQERPEFRKWLTKYGITTPPPTPGTVIDSSLLAFIYRALPETERTFRRGLSLELRTAEISMEKAVNGAEQEDTRLSSMAQALIDAGIALEALKPSEYPDAELHDLSLEERSTAERLTAIVLLAGQWGMVVPLDLLLRIIGSEGSHRIVSIVRRFDIFRWTEDERGEQYLGTRTALEAKLLAREDLPSEVEADVVQEIIANLRIASDRGGGTEVAFLVDLMDKIGPQSKSTRTYSQYFKSWADSLADLRLGGIPHVRLALMEANLLREYTRWTQQKGLATPAERLGWLQDCQQLLEAALEDSDTTGRSRLSLYVELASSIGYQVNERIRSSNPTSHQIVSQLGDVLRAALRARTYDPENIYPIDVIAWSTRDALQHADLPIGDRLNLLANAAASVDSVDEDALNPSQGAMFLNRRADIARLLEDRQLEAEYLRRLSESHDPAAFYLLARRMERDQGAAAAFDVLDKAPKTILRDWKCGRLYFETYWEVSTGQKFLKGERVTIPFRRGDWVRTLEIVDLLTDAADFDKYRLDFAKGMALFHLGELKQSDEVFRELDRESGGLSNRIRALYLASELDGTALARRFTGRVSWASPDGKRGQVWVEQLRANVNFIPQRWATSSYRARDEILPDFQISFNMRGPLAEPIRLGSIHDSTRIGSNRVQ